MHRSTYLAMCAGVLTVVSVASATLPAQQDVAANAAETGAVTGIVTMAGVPVKGALVHLAGADTTVTTDAKGAYTIAGLAPGNDTLVIDHVGSEPARIPIALAAGITSSMPVSVSVPTSIDTLNIEALRLNRAYARVGFDRRRMAGGGYFLDQTAIGQRGVQRLTDLLRTAPGFRVRYVGSRNALVSTRGSCVAYYIDRMRYRPLHAGDVDDIARPTEIAAVEAYASHPPAEFGGGHGCAAVVIWTKTGLGT